jgi:hypothetical protein
MTNDEPRRRAAATLAVTDGSTTAAAVIAGTRGQVYRTVRYTMCGPGHPDIIGHSRLTIDLRGEAVLRVEELRVRASRVRTPGGILHVAHQPMMRRTSPHKRRTVRSISTIASATTGLSCFRIPRTSRLSAAPSWGIWRAWSPSLPDGTARYYRPERGSPSRVTASHRPAPSGSVARATAEATSEIGYVRLHGRNDKEWFAENKQPSNRYNYLYSVKEPERKTDRVRSLTCGRAARAW